MHNESRVIYSRCRFLGGQGRQRDAERKFRESDKGWRDQDRSAGARDKAQQQAHSSLAANNRFSLLSSHLCSLDLSIFQQFLPTSAVHSLILVHAYLSVVLLHLQLSLFSSKTWCSSIRIAPSVCLTLSLSILQHLLSGISLSPVRWCWEQPSLSVLPSLSSSLSLFLFHTYEHFPVFILRRAQTLSLCRSLPFVHVPSPSPPPLFSLDLSMTESCPSKLWVLLCLAFASVRLLVNSRFCSFNRTKSCGQM